MHIEEYTLDSETGTSRWDEVFRELGPHDFYHTSWYHRIAARRGEGTPVLFVACHDGEARLAIPLLLRSFRDDPCLSQVAMHDSDVTSVYGYAGPIAKPEITACEFTEIMDLILNRLREQRIISLFSRLHPFFSKAKLLAGFGEVIQWGRTISIDLRGSEEATHAGYNQITRRSLRKLQAVGITCEQDTTLRYLSEFIQLYHESMKRVDAAPFYFFTEEYFRELLAGGAGAIQLFVARQGTNVLSGGIFSIYGAVAQYHLGGTYDHALKAGSFRLVIETARQWAHRLGATWMHLGGGLGGKDDSLFQFKAGFSKQTNDFYLWLWEINTSKCSELRNLRLRWIEAQGMQPVCGLHFPAYRISGEPTPTHLTARLSRKMDLTILVSSAGQRNHLIRCFREDARRLGVSLRVLATDIDPKHSAACQEADQSFQVPVFNDPSFPEHLKDICRREGVGLLLPTIDPPLQLWSTERRNFATVGTRVMISDPEIVQLAQDKKATAEYLLKIGVLAPRTMALVEYKKTPDTLNWPVIVKPNAGSSSVGVLRPRTPDEIISLENDRNYIVQEMWTGQEYTVNLFFDQAGQLRCAIPHLRLEVRNGEVFKGSTVRHPELLAVAQKIGIGLVGAMGVLCFQAIVAPDGKVAVFEINARFGGGYPLAHRAGARFSQWLLEEVCNLPCTAHDNWKENVLMLRYPSAAFVDA